MTPEQLQLLVLSLTDEEIDELAERAAEEQRRRVRRRQGGVVERLSEAPNK